MSPNLQIIEGSLDLAEVVTISAPAAVGKSVTAQHLAATTRAPLLDLATVPVGKDSLRGLLSGYSSSPGRAIEAFHRGQLPVIVDALDEGALLSGVPALEAFVESAAAFVREGRRTPGRVKLLILGRDDSVRYRSNLVFELTSDVPVCSVRLDFFERPAAMSLIPLYAARELERLHDNHHIDEGIFKRRLHALPGKPMRDLIEAHFEPIEYALGIAEGQLWDDEKGRAFAGYAPVLSSIGILLAEVDNPQRLASRLRQAGTNEAWRVIATVMDDVLEREQRKLAERIDDTAIISGDPYAPDEQLQYLTDLFHGRPLKLVDTLSFRDAAAAQNYEVKVGQISREHPFVKDSAMANDVLGSRVLAYAVMNDRVGPDLGVLKAISRQPFLWRFVRGDISRVGQLPDAEDPLVDGRYLGCILASYWNDPAEPDGRKVTVSEIPRGDAQGLVHVTVNADTAHEISLRIMPPISFYARLQDCIIETDYVPVSIEGTVARTQSSSSGADAYGASAFAFRGDVSLITPNLSYSCDAAILERCDDRSGSLWLEADEVNVSATNPAFDVDDGSEYGWGGAIADSRPWAYLSDATLTGPHEASTLIHLIYECQKRVRNRIVVESAYAIPRDDPSLNWARRDYDHVFKLFFAPPRRQRTRRRRPRQGYRREAAPLHDQLRRALLVQPNRGRPAPTTRRARTGPPLQRLPQRLRTRTPIRFGIAIPTFPDCQDFDRIRRTQLYCRIHDRRTGTLELEVAGALSLQDAAQELAAHLEWNQPYSVSHLPPSQEVPRVYVVSRPRWKEIPDNGRMVQIEIQSKPIGYVTLHV